MKKVLFVATVAKKHINVFHLPYLQWFKENGYETHVCAKNDFESNEDPNIPFCDKFIQLPFERSPLKVGNYQVFQKLKDIINYNNYEIIHCHTPIGGVLARMAAMSSRKKGTKIIYTAHGFHFYKGAAYKNWFFYYSIEKLFANFTDCLITINNEDYRRAIDKRFNAKKIRHVHGVGVDTKKYAPINLKQKEILRKKHGFNLEDFILIYPAELNNNKNQKLLIKVVEILKDTIPNVKLILAGQGGSLEEYEFLVNKKNLNENVIFPGFREDISEFIKLSDVSVASSVREGLGLNVIEGMACGLPVVATYNRGHRELVNSGENGFLIKNENLQDFVKALKKIYENENLRIEYGKKSLELVKLFSLNNVQKEVEEIYIEMLRNGT